MGKRASRCGRLDEPPFFELAAIGAEQPEDDPLSRGRPVSHRHERQELGRHGGGEAHRAGVPAQRGQILLGGVGDELRHQELPLKRGDDAPSIPQKLPELLDPRAHGADPGPCADPRLGEGAARGIALGG